MTDHHEFVRTPEKVASDLAKAMQVSRADLLSARKGILPISLYGPLLTRLLRPLLKGAGFILLPLITAAYFASSSNGRPFIEGFGIVFSRLGNLKDFAEEHGWVRTILYIKALVLPAGYGILQMTKVPLDVLRDMISKRVKLAEGRVTTREEEKKGKRDPVSFYYFQMKDRSYSVSRKTYLAIDDGGSYRVYYLPRSFTLVAIEPTVVAREAEERAHSESAQEAPE